LTTLGSLVVPFSVVSGIFGMNLRNLPIHIDFALLMGITFGASLLLLMLILGIRWWTERKPAEEEVV